MSSLKSSNEGASQRVLDSANDNAEAEGRGGRSTGLYLFGVVVLIAAVGGVALLTRTRHEAAASEASSRVREVAAGPRITVARAARGAAERHLQLQGEARPYASVTLYAKVSGYLKQIHVDKGDRVRRGQVLAVIESPELDRQYDAAVADAAYKRANAKRAQALSGPGVISARDAELDQSQATVADATVAALQTQKSYEVLRAPFDGVVTSRFADPGALVQNATNAQTSALPVVTVSVPGTLRVYVYVDQRDAGQVKVGDSAEVHVPGSSAPAVKGTVTRLAQELDSRTRMMLVEVDLDNRGGVIVPNSFVDVTLTVRTAPLLEVPVEALVLRGGNKPFVAVVAKDGRVSYKPVTVASDDGSRVRLGGGIAEGDLVALNLGDNVADGGRVQPIVPGGANAGSAR